ncbi:MAG: RagB/SusD family nutrient uptake outer membrane protein [Bacteroidales bacterium]
MKNIIKTIPIILLLTIVGCNDLTEEVYSDLTVDTYKYTANEIYGVIGPVYSNLRGYYGQGHLVLDVSSDITCMPANASGWDDGGIYKKIHLHTWNSEAPQVRNIWNLFYRGVLHANRIVDQLVTNAVPVPSDVNRESLIAEMKVARAFYYWQIIDNYGDAPFVTSVSQELPASTPRKTIYTAIVADINDALDKLSSDNNKITYGRFNKWAAKALLANLYLNAKVYTGTAEWDKCLAECNDIIASGKYQLEPNYADCFKAQNQNSIETIFALPMDEINGSSVYINSTLHASSKAKYTLRTTPWGAGSVKAIPQFIDTYDPADSRIDDTWERGLQFAANGTTRLMCLYDRAGQQLNYTKEVANGLYTPENEGYRIIKYKPEIGATNPQNNDVPFFRYAQVLMMKAECLLRTGQAAAAADIVTEVRQRAFKSQPAKATVTAAQLTANSKYVYGYVENYVIADPGDQTPVEFGGFYDELGYEFACEWGRRRDMIRFGTYSTKSWLSHKPQGAKINVFPIPQSYLDANPNYQQNPNYAK